MSSVSNATAASTKTFVTALVFNLAVFGIEIVAFTLVRRYFKAIYEPKSYISPESKRSPSLGQSLLTWPLLLWHADFHDIKRVNGLDAYFYVRFLRMMAIIFLPIWLISWAVLLPLTSVNNDNGGTGLERFTFGNVEPGKKVRYAAHIILAWFFTAWIWYNIRREMSIFITERQEYLISEKYSASAQASTVLITGVPRRYLTESAITKMYSHLPGGVRKVWLNRDLKEMPELYNQRLNACNKLESAETSLFNIAANRKTKKEKKAAKAAKKAGKPDDIPLQHGQSIDGRPLTAPSILTNAGDEEKDLTLVDKLVPRAKRPSHRLPAGFMPFSLPFIGQKVDSIDWAKEEIERTSGALSKSQRVLAREVNTMTRSSVYADMPLKELAAELDKQSYPPLNSAFVLFNKQIAAHMAAQALAHHEPYQMSDKYVDVLPQDVIWDNLSMNPYEAKLRMVISYTATAALIILWAFPVAFVGIVSNISKLSTTYKWLGWLGHLPGPVTGIISGILPPVLLAVLMMLLPIILRMLARFEGIPKKTGLELSLMTRYFIFQVVHSFLIVTLSSGIIAALPQLVSDPTSIPSLLANNLPAASNFFLTYIILQGLSGTGAGFLQIVALIVYYVKLYLLGSTPRSVYGIKYTMRSVAWGTLFPGTTLIVVIALGYSLISPIINGLACATFFLFYMTYKYLFLWQFDQPASGETGGLFYPKAMQHIFVGLYVQQVCLAALFFLGKAIPEGALMIVLIIFTIGFHTMINNSYNPLRYALPLSLADKSYSAASEEIAAAGDNRSIQDDPEKDVQAGTSENQIEEVDDFETLDGPKDFNHPASVEAQRTVWLPQDQLGLAEVELADIRSKKIDVSTENATMNAKGTVDISGRPPGEPVLE